MDFSDYEFLPGTVINVEDPEKRGRIKACVPTWFDTSVMQEEALPWIVPSSMGGYQRFSKLEMGSKVWVIHKKESNKEYWYLPMFELNDKTQEIVDDYESPEVLLSRTEGKSGVYVYYNSKNGLVLKNGDLEIQLNNDKEIHITDGTSSFNIKGSNITIGKSDDQQEAIMGRQAKDLFMTIAKWCTMMEPKIASKYPIADLSADFMQLGKDITEGCSDILSKTVKISK